MAVGDTVSGAAGEHSRQAASRSYATVCVYTPSAPVYLPQREQHVDFRSEWKVFQLQFQSTRILGGCGLGSC